MEKVNGEDPMLLMNVLDLKKREQINGFDEALEEGEYVLDDITQSMGEINPTSHLGTKNLSNSLALLGFPQGSSDKEDEEGWSQATTKRKNKKKLDVGGGNKVGIPSQKESRINDTVRDVVAGKQRTLDSIVGLKPKKKWYGGWLV